ncbi:hypothetical protein UPYG_G00086040 [Umbra pygmaea]|uniref:Uncharacterized protein n=1 Tax=Umbra pygmaea TaxID=75934 RepID=A0ABD0XER3_UMBPY
MLLLFIPCFRMEITKPNQHCFTGVNCSCSLVRRSNFLCLAKAKYKPSDLAILACLKHKEDQSLFKAHFQEAFSTPTVEACWSRERIAGSRTPRSSGRWCWTRKRVCRCSPSSPKGNRRGALAAIARLKTATCSRPWTNTGTRTVSNVHAAIVASGKWAPPSTRKPTSSSVAETI